MLFPRFSVFCSLINPFNKTTNFKLFVMGRGDVKTKRGKIFNKSFGKTRTARTRKAAAAAAPKAEKKA